MSSDRVPGVAASLAAVLLLAGCGDFPRPFMGYPGATARRLSQPPPARLAVPVPGEVLLPQDAATIYAGAVAAALVDREVPAVAEPVKPGDWRLRIAAETRGAVVVATYTVENPKGEGQGATEGKPVPIAVWSTAAPPMLKQVAADAAPDIATLLARIEAVRRQSDPKSLYNRPARVVVRDVTGAPGDGNARLTALLRDQLVQDGELVQDQETGADFAVAGTVKVVPTVPGTERVEVQWVVSTLGGDERGRVVQLNEIPAGTLNHYWGEVALVVAREAAGGVKDVILQQSGRRDAPVAPANATAPATAGTSPATPAAPPLQPAAGN